MSTGGEFRVGSDAPEVPAGASSACGTTWPSDWEDRVEARPECRREPGHEGAHQSRVTGVDGLCWRYEWGAGREPRVERC